MKTFYLHILVFIMLSFVCCTDIFERDLSDHKVELISPADELTTKEYNNTFWWNFVDGSLWYELQVASPTFSYTTSLELDTILETNNFQFSLQPGVYQWRVRAFNGSSSTRFTTNSLIVIDNSK